MSPFIHEFFLALLVVGTMPFVVQLLKDERQPFIFPFSRGSEVSYFKTVSFLVLCVAYVYTFLCAHVYAGTHLRVCMGMWKSEVDIKYLSLFPTLFLRQGLPLSLELTAFALWFRQQVPGILLTLAPSTEIAGWLFISGTGIQTQVFMLALCEDC